MQFKDRLAGRRKNLNWSQQELASKAKVSERAISNYESGKGLPTPSVLAKLAVALGVSPEWLFSGQSREETSAVLREEPARPGLSTEAVRLALRMLKSQANALASQIGLYEDQLCGPSSEVEREVRSLWSAADKLADAELAAEAAQLRKPGGAGGGRPGAASPGPSREPASPNPKKHSS